MANSWRACAAVAGSIIAGACAAPRRGEAFQPEIVDPARAVIYVFRDGGLRQRPVWVFINQEAVGTLLPGQYLSHTVPAAETLVRVEADSSSARPVRLRPGDSAYMQVVIPPLGPLNPTLELRDSDAARRVLNGTTRAKP